MSPHGTVSTAGPTAPGSTAARAPGDGSSNGKGSGRPADRATVPVAAPPRTRRRTGVLAAGVALVALGSLAAVYLTRVVGHTVPVVAVVRDVPAGQVLVRGDLAVAQVSTDPAVRPVPAARMDALVGRRAAVSLIAGSLVTEGAVTDRVQPSVGRSLVGVALTRAQLPAEPLTAGDQVRIVDTPTNQGEPPTTSPASIAGVVVSSVGPDNSGLTVVDVTVPAEQAAGLAARVATGRVALVLDSRER